MTSGAATSPVTASPWLQGPVSTCGDGVLKKVQSAFCGGSAATYG